MPLRLTETDPTWEQEFQQTRSMLLQATEGWIHEVVHVGGTALSGIVAQPVIDLIAGLPDLQGLNEAALRIEGLNFARVEAPEWCEAELAAQLIKPRRGEATHRVLLVRRSGDLWRQILAIQECLSTNFIERQRLDSIKRDHFQQGCTAALAYEGAKQTFFSELLDRIQKQ